MKKIFLMMFLFSIVLSGQSYQETSDALLEISKGNIPGHSSSTGSSSPYWDLRLPKKFVGPCIIKIQGHASTSDVDGSAGFDLILVDKPEE